jgi:hypothetical protein
VSHYGHLKTILARCKNHTPTSCHVHSQSLNPLSPRISAVHDVGLGKRAVGIDEDGKARGPGQQLVKSPSCLVSISAFMEVTPGVPPGRCRLATRPAWTGSMPPPKMIGIVEVAAFAANVTGVPIAIMPAT